MRPRRVHFWEPVTPHVFPHLLPTPIFVSKFSDLLYPARRRDGRAAAALGTLMSATGCDLYTAIGGDAAEPARLSRRARFASARG